MQGARGRVLWGVVLLLLLLILLTLAAWMQIADYFTPGRTSG